MLLVVAGVLPNADEPVPNTLLEAEEPKMFALVVEGAVLNAEGLLPKAPAVVVIALPLKILELLVVIGTVLNAGELPPKVAPVVVLVEEPKILVLVVLGVNELTVVVVPGPKILVLEVAPKTEPLIPGALVVVEPGETKMFSAPCEVV